MHISRPVKFLLIAVFVAIPPGLGSGGQESSETTTTSTPFTLKIERNEVPVRVVVRDRNGRPVRNLTKDDFQIFDNGKPQVITQFSSEGAAPAASKSAETAPSREISQGATETTQPAPAPKIAERFVAIYFDDLSMDFEAIARTRIAATKYLQNSIQPTDRVALYTSSGQVTQDFTADRDKIDAALRRLSPVGMFKNVGNPCPDLSDYEAYLIVENNNQQALAIAVQKVINCMCNGDAQHCPNPEAIAEQAARERWSRAEVQRTYSLHGLDDLVRRLSVLPGQRSVVFISNGFLTGKELDTISRVVDHAVRAGVVVNSLDARGLYTLIPGGDASQRGPGLSGALAGWMVQIEDEGAHVDAEVLDQIAEGTGGVFFQNNNDFDAGFRATGGLAEYSYVLVFSPSDLKPDGKFHKLKVVLVGDVAKEHLAVQARRGYFAGSKKETPAEVESAEIRNAVFSREELNSERLRIGTRFFKASPEEAQVKVVAHLDTQGLAFRDESDRHIADVTFVTAIFDTNGNFIQGLRKDVTLRLRDRTLEYVRADGISISSDFKMPPGNYLVREVVRDDGGMVSSMNDSLEIPY